VQGGVDILGLGFESDSGEKQQNDDKVLAHGGHG
jgi:hypothetical protein